MRKERKEAKTRVYASLPGIWNTYHPGYVPLSSLGYTRVCDSLSFLGYHPEVYPGV